MKKSKLILAMYIGVVTLAVASVSMSVAWFFASRTLYVNSINITLDTDRDLKISKVRDNDYVDHIDYTDPEAYRDFMPLTSAHSSLWTSEQKDSPIFYDESGSSDIEHFVSYRPVEEGYGYFTQKFYLLADDDVYVTINPDKTYIEKNEEFNPGFAQGIAGRFVTLREKYQNDPATYAHAYEAELANLHYFTKDEINLDEDALAAKILERLNKVVDAMRFSILIKDQDEYSYTIIDPNKSEVTLLGGLLDNSVDQYYDSWFKEESNEWYERVYGEVSGEPVYDDPFTGTEAYKDPNDLPSAFNARHKQGVRTYNEAKSLANGFKIAEEQSLDLDDLRGITKYHFPVYDGVPKEVVISIYLEGWDLDSVNYTMGATFNASLAFKIEREM